MGSKCMHALKRNNHVYAWKLSAMTALASSSTGASGGDHSDRSGSELASLLSVPELAAWNTIAGVIEGGKTDSCVFLHVAVQASSRMY
jgi:hypothetical protein